MVEKKLVGAFVTMLVISILTVIFAPVINSLSGAVTFSNITGCNATAGETCGYFMRGAGYNGLDKAITYPEYLIYNSIGTILAVIVIMMFIAVLVKVVKEAI